MGATLIAMGLAALGGFAALLWMRRRADRNLPDAARLPMQWSFSGKVNWTLPRRTALAFMPMLYLLVMAFIMAMAFLSREEMARGSGAMLVGLVVFTTAFFLAIFGTWLHLVRLTLEREGERK